MDHLFLSDAHIGAFDEDTNNKIESSLCNVADWCLKSNIQLHILGDLFDYWMEYESHVPELGKKILASLENYNKSARLPATFITGNHDNWTRGYFESLGFNLKEDYSIINENGISIFLHHGDGISDKTYNLNRPLLHKILRNKTFVSVYQKLLSADFGLRLMKKFSAFNRERGITNTEPLNKWSEWFLKTHEFDVVICGHDHVARVLTYPFGTYINLGTFFELQTACLYTNNGFELVKWDDGKNEFTKFEKDLQKTPL